MDYTGRVTSAIGIGIVLSMFYSRKTSWSAGLVVPGLMAVQLGDVISYAACLGMALIIWIFLRLASKFVTLYGREQTGAALLLAVALRFLFGSAAGVFWIGWAATGLIAADMERQGVGMTLCTVVSASAATNAIMTFIVTFV